MSGAGLGLAISRSASLAAGLVLGIGLLILVCRFPRVGLYLLLALALGEKLAFAGQYAVTLTAGKMVGWVASLGWAVNIVITRKIRLKKTGQEIALAAFLFLSFASVLWARNLPLYRARLFTIVQLIVLFYMINTMIDSRRRLLILLWIVLLSISLSGVISITQYLLDPRVRPVGIGRDPNFTAALSIMGMFIILTLMQTRPPPPLRIFLIGNLFILVIGIILTRSRGAIATFAFIVFLWLLTEKKKSRALIMVAVIGLVFIFVAPEKFYRRMATLAQGTEEASIANRLLETRTSLMILQENILLGVGAGNFSAHYLRFVNPIIPEPRRAHNTYLEVAAEYGIIGFAVFIWLIVNTWRSFQKARALAPEGTWLAEAPRFLLLGYLGYLIASIFIVTTFEKYFWFLLALGPALYSVIKADHDARAIGRGPARLDNEAFSPLSGDGEEVAR